jgi:hypothetical protein
MSRLKPGATYIYEKAMGVTYARELGSHPGDRFEIGRDYPGEQTFLGYPVSEVAELVAMKKAAESNLSLQDAMERAKILYELSRDHTPDTTPKWHPV